MQYNQEKTSVNLQTLGVTESEFDDKKPVLFMLMGIPGCGKSFYAKWLADSRKAAGRKVCIISTDALRQEIYGDENDKEHNADVFGIAKHRIKVALAKGMDVIFDATNINKKRRTSFMKDFSSMTCKRVCCAIMTEYDECLKRNSNRERTVPEYVIRRMYTNWEPPHYQDGFDEIYFISGQNGKHSEKYSLMNLVSRQEGFLMLDQENSHHSHTLGVHCLMAMIYVLISEQPNTRLQIAALLHDVGKEFTKSRLNHRGEFDGNYHYYQHHCVSSYESYFYLNGLAYSNIDIVHIANLIYYHMHPHCSWKQSEKAMLRDKAKIGDDMFREIMLLHEADLAAQ